MPQSANFVPTFRPGIITADGTWIYEFRLQTGQQLSKCRSEKNTPKPLKNLDVVYYLSGYLWFDPASTRSTKTNGQ